MTKSALLFTLLATTFAWAQENTPAPAPATPVPAAESPATTDPAAPPATPEAPAEPEIPDDGVRVSVLGYHDFSETQPETAMRIRTSKFRQQMEALRQMGLTVISMGDFIAWKKGEKTLPPKCVVITLDDGWKSVYTDAFPILKEYKYPFTLYLYKSYVDGGGKALTTGMIEEMLAAGATLGSHSVSHPYPGTVKAMRKKGADAYDAFLRKELGESKRFLESQFPKHKATTYAYPGGFYTEEMLPLADEFGYTHLFTVLPGKVKRGMPAKTLPRYIILGNYDKIFEFATTFREAGSDAGGAGAPGGVPGGGIGQAPVQTTPYPVTPEAGAVINTRLPEISADLSTLENFDPASLVMKVGGFGEVPATFDPAEKKFTWKINRRLRQPSCEVTVTWKDMTGKPHSPPLRWSFRIDRNSAYQPDGE
ncbi:MAG: polysaccharide deacetylase family protein [Akkermansiaceae bacterium]|nr:polysaccharide deacetylase family protein [Akkermansiaceae bacterium]